MTLTRAWRICSHVVFHAGSIGSAFVLLVLVVGWMRGYWHEQTLQFEGSWTAVDVSSVAGEIQLEVIRYEREFPRSVRYWQDPQQPIRLAQSINTMRNSVKPGWIRISPWRRAGLDGAELTSIDTTPNRKIRIVAIPAWAIVPFFAPLPLLWLGKLRQLSNTRAQRNRQRRGHCAQCGYDIRSSGSRCPECGAAK